MLRRLRVKFICVNMGIVVAMLAVIFGMVLGFTRQNLERESTALLQSALGPGERREGEFGLREDRFDREGEERRGLPGGFRPYISLELDAEGSILSAEGLDTEDTEELCAIVAVVEAAGGESGLLSDYGLRYLRGETPTGTTRLVLLDVSSETSTMHGLIRTSLLIGGASILVFFVISILLARWAVKPVEEAWRQQKQFVSDASHELKTPLTVIMTNAELLQSPDYDPAAKARFGEHILTMARQMRGLVESLLELARVDNGAVAATRQAEVDFSALCADAVLPFEPLCFEKGMLLTSDVAEGVRLHGSGSHLRQVVEILLDNAQKYADPDSEIAVRLTRGGRTCLLSVADRGAPIAEEDRKRLFERFYRADKARGRDGSYGLGLAIAQKIVEDHQGKIWVESENGWNTFFVSLPVLA